MSCAVVRPGRVDAACCGERYDARTGEPRDIWGAVTGGTEPRPARCAVRASGPPQRSSRTLYKPALCPAGVCVCVCVSAGCAWRETAGCVP